MRLTPLLPGYIASATYGFRHGYCAMSLPDDGPNYLFVYDSTIVLAAGESQRGVLDFRVRSSCEVVKPFFNDDTLDLIRVEPQP